MTATSLGPNSVASDALKNLEAGAVVTRALNVASGATPKIGQVLEYDPVAKTWKDFTTYDPANRVPLAIFADRILNDDDSTVLTADTLATCIIAGAVNVDALTYAVVTGVLEAGPVQTKTLTVKTGVDPTLGQVLEYDDTAQSWKEFTAYAADGLYAVFADRAVADPGNALGEDTDAVCIVAGRVNFAVLDATAKADGDIDAALIASTIDAVTLADVTADADDIAAAMLPNIVTRTLVAA